MKNKLFPVMSAALLSLLFLSACGGSSSNDKSVIIEGDLNQGASSDHKLFKHSEGEHIGEVEICALGECSTTNTEGEWGFATSEDLNGNEVSFKFTGHGIDTTTIVKIPDAEENVLIKFVHSANVVTIAEMLVDGQEDHSNHDHAHE